MYYICIYTKTYVVCAKQFQSGRVDSASNGRVSFFRSVFLSRPRLYTVSVLYPSTSLSRVPFLVTIFAYDCGYGYKTFKTRSRMYDLVLDLNRESRRKRLDKWKTSFASGEPSSVK